MKKGWKLGIAIVLIVVILFVLWKSCGHYLDIDRIEKSAEKLLRFGLLAVIFMALLIVIQQIVTFIPFLSLTTVNVMLYGLWKGFLLSWMASIIGAIVAFWLARGLLQNWIIRRWGNNATFQKINKNLAESGFFYVLMGRLFPIMPSNLINFGAGISRISLVAYIIATVIGNIPFVYTSSLMANDLLNLENEQNQNRLTYVSIGLAIFVVMSLALKLVRDRSKRRQTNM